MAKVQTSQTRVCHLISKATTGEQLGQLRNVQQLRLLPLNILLHANLS